MARETMTGLRERAEASEHERWVLSIALDCVVTETAQMKEQASDDGWRYWLSAYRLTSAHGGVVVIRSKCLGNRQKASAIALYLDEAVGRFSYTLTPNMALALQRIVLRRRALLDAECELAVAEQDRREHA